MPLLAALVLSAGALGPATPADGSWGPWRVLLPLDHPDGHANVAVARAPEEELARMALGGAGPDPERDWPAKGDASVRWRELELAPPFGDQSKLDLVKLSEPLAGTNAVAYLHRTIEAREACTVEVRVGSDDGMRMWLNGALVHDHPAHRGLKPGEDRVPLALEPGTNHLFVKVVQGGGAWAFQLIRGIEPRDELREPFRAAVDDAIDRGVEWLLRQQELDGSWRYDEGNKYPTGMTAFAVYTLLESGVPPEHHAIRRALAFMRARAPAQTYSLSVRLLALGELHDPGVDDEMEELLEALLDLQEDGWAYPSGNPDLSNTQYALLGLRAAAKQGLDVPDAAWRDAARWVLDRLDADGGFNYRSDRRATGSMTVAGIASLAICREEGKLRAGLRKEIGEVTASELDWLAKRWDVHSNPIPHGQTAEATRWWLYYLYGIERVGDLLGVERIGGHPWYWEGAHVLLSVQGEGGGWAAPGYGEDQPNTCYALLFLQRATATRSGRGESRATRTYGDDDPARAVSLRAAGDAALSVWISSFGRETRERFSWPGEAERGPRVASVEYLVGDEVVATVAGDRTRAAGAERFAARLEFDRPGPYVLSARVTLASPAEGERDVVLLAPTLEVDVRESTEPWMLAYAVDGAANLLVGAKHEVRATSFHAGGSEAAKAFDGRAGTAWMAKAGDAGRELVLELGKPIRANRLHLLHARPDVLVDGHAGRATRVEVFVNRKKKPYLLELDPDVRRRGELEFTRTESIRRLTLRIVDYEPGTTLKDAVGFAEVELHLVR